LPRVAIALSCAAILGAAGATAAREMHVHPVKIVSSSMAPTVKRGEWIVVHDHDTHVDRGDIVLFRFPLGTSGRAIKRVVALGGDRVTITTHHVTVNGHAIAIAGGPSATARRPRTEVVAPGHVFLLGDNAAVSIDSRSFGAVPESELVGRELLVLGGPGRIVVALLIGAGLVGLPIVAFRAGA
jgi:signal peptidase I